MIEKGSLFHFLKQAAFLGITWFYERICNKTSSRARYLVQASIAECREAPVDQCATMFCS